MNAGHKERNLMSKYDPLWEFIQKNGGPAVQLSFDEIRDIMGIEIDHSFLSYKKELTRYGYQVGKISLKKRTVIFNQTDRAQ